MLSSLSRLSLWSARRVIPEDSSSSARVLQGVSRRIRCTAVSFGCGRTEESPAGGHVCVRWPQDTAVISGREQARLQEELELVRRQVAQLAHVMQVSHRIPGHLGNAT